jgi:hypothetical protein
MSSNKYEKRNIVKNVFVLCYQTTKYCNKSAIFFFDWIIVLSL